MQQGKEFRNDALYLVCYEYLVAIQLNLVTLHVNAVLDAWEVENTRQIEWEIYVQMNPEQWVVLHWIEGVIELLIVLILQSARSLGPERLHIINNVILVSLHVLTVLPLSLFAEGYRHCHKLAVLVQEFLDLVLLEEFLAVVCNMENDVRTTLCLVCILDFESR